MAWTKEQLAAMQKNSGNLLVAAGAGSGKTAVLIERVLGIITDEVAPVDVDNLLIVTFTNAAAAEMRSRLVAALRQKLDADPQNSLILRQIVLMQRAHIMTIHSFCLELLKEHGYLLGLDAKSHIGSEGELALLKERTMDDVFEAAYADDASGLKLLLAHYSRALGDDSLRALVLNLLDFAQSMPDVEGWLSSVAAVYQQRNPSLWLDYFVACLQNDLAELAAQAATLAAMSQAVPQYQPTIEAEAAAITALAQSVDTLELPDLLAALDALKFDRLPSVPRKSDVDPAEKDRVKAARDRLKKAVAQLRQDAHPVLSGAYLAELDELAPLAQALVNLTLNFYRAWQAAKRRARLWEFSDLEHYALQLLQNPDFAVAADLRARFYEVLVDEYQDVNRVQEALLAAVSREDNRFIVGDIKQSIYRFRLAEPSLFMEKFAAYGVGQGGTRIDLNRNFRSQPWVLAGVNFIFSRLMRGGSTEIVYDEAARLYPGRDDMPCEPCELLIIDKAAVQDSFSADIDPADDDTDSDTDADTADLLSDMHTWEMEGRVLAGRILAEKAAGRSFGDMVILLRAVKTAAPIITRELAAQGIPCVTDSQEDFISLPEVQTVLNLLAVLDNPRQDIPLAALLHSPLVGLPLADLADLRLPGQKISLYDGLRQTHRPDLLQFLLNLDDWRQKSRELGVADLLDYIYNATALPDLMAALPGGAQRRRNLDDILRLAAEYDESGGLGLARFIRFLQAAGRRQASSADQTAPDAVRLMTIHKSKGLQFPVVFVAGLGSKLNEDDFKRDILLHRTLGLGMRRVDLAARRKYLTFGYNVIMRRSRWENIAEALRILYVALTRAEHKLVLVGTCKADDLAKKLAALSPADDVPAGFLSANRSFLLMVAAALLPHPDAAPLRELAGVSEFAAAACSTPGANGRWQINIIRGLSAQQQAQAAPGFNFAAWLAQPPADSTESGLAQSIAAALAPADKSQLSHLPVKWSATSLDSLQALTQPDEQENPAAPLDIDRDPDEFAEDLAAASAPAHPADWYATFGSCTHAILERVSLERIAAGSPPADELAQTASELAAQYPADVLAAVDTARLSRLFDTPLFARLLAAVRSGAPVLREQRFAAALSVAELKELDVAAWGKLAAATGLDLSALPDEQLFFQGVIDLAFWDEVSGGWLLVDYKTGAHRTLTNSAVAQKYAWQLGLYRHVLARATRQPVAGGCILFTAGARTVRIF